ncbi:[NiFe] hydrogenase metallocenter assembly protein HypE [Escherichia coli IS9]|nr:AIR synthase related protein [Escherichia coli]CDK56856.1 [NiFe] hydrogenase metallocenter assembly protein HypE [Escherichia coli IS9]
MNNIQLAHGSGGQAMQQLINSLFMEAFANPWLAEQEDQARLDLAQLVAEGDRLAFSTDSYVIDPLFFPGGNIGKLAICGTANDVAVSGAIPRYLSCGFILEEGLPMETLKAVVTSMAETARTAGIAIVTGDTKVVQRGAADKLFINTAGMGAIPANIHWGAQTLTAGDVLAGTTPLAEIQEDTRMMFQDARLLPWKSVIDNVGLGLKGQWRDAARRALAAVGLENRAGEWPAALSGGQKQRVALARALIHRPGLLLLDEPLGALDALTRLEMQDLIVSLWQEHGFTVLLVTHDVSEAVAMADRVLLIEEGKIGLDLTVDIPRPRRLGSVRLAELEAEVLQRVMRRGHSEQLIRRHG